MIDDTDLAEIAETVARAEEAAREDAWVEAVDSVLATLAEFEADGWNVRDAIGIIQENFVHS